MRVGITSPVVTQVPGVCSEWERTAGVEDLATIAEVADKLGFHHLTCSEHVGIPEEHADQRGATYWDPLATFGHLAAHTSRIRLVTQVLVLGYHHPLEIAKRYGTLDLVSGGRLVLGLGVGSLHEEFALIGAPFEGRGPRADDAIAALRASLSRREPEYHGTHYDFAGFVVEPHAVQHRVPIWIGGRTPRSLRRAVTYGDGWVPFGLGTAQLQETLGQVTLPTGFDVVLPTGRALNPAEDPAGAKESLTRLRDAGATLVGAQLRATSTHHYCEQLEALAGIAADID